MFYFVRHGETVLNAEGRINRFDTPLNEKGKSQATQAGEILKGHGIKRLYASDTLRTQQTAQIINQTAGLNLEIHPDIRLREFGFGDHEGNTKLKDFEPLYDEMYKNPQKFGIEPLPDAFIRVRNFFAAIEESDISENVCVVCHGGIMHMINFAYIKDEFDAGLFTKMATNEYKNTEIMQLDLAVPRKKRKAVWE